MHANHLAFPRRSLIAGASIATAAGLAGMTPRAGLAKMTMPTNQAPYYYRFKLGDAQATIVSDGPLPLGEPGASFLGLSKEEIERQLTENFLPTNSIVLEQNILVITINGNTVLFDTGMGVVKAFGPTTGQLMKTLEGIARQSG